MKIAAIVDDLLLSQNSFYLIKNFNALGQNNKHQPYCFYHNSSGRPIKPLFSIMHVYYATYFYSGKLIATNFSTLRTLLNIHTNSEKYFYVWDPEWLREGFDYVENVRLMRDKSIKLIARSKSHASLITNYCNKPVSHIIENWDYRELEKI